MIRIVADEKIPFLKGVLELFAEIKYLPGYAIDRKAAKNADALMIRTRTRCNRSLLENTPVKFIGTATIGFDHIDTQYCEKENIKWTNAPGCNSSSVQQYIASALFTIAEENHFNLKDKTIGIIGVGNVGSKVEKLARSIGMKVILNDPPKARQEGDAKYVNLKELLKESDIVTLHVPLNIAGDDKTYHLIEFGMIRKMKRGAWLINTSRGEVINSLCLSNALIFQRLAGAVLDVWENEPNIDHELMKMAFIATPHIAGYSTDGKANGTSMVVKTLCNFFNLPLADWYPSDLPAPDDKVISIDGGGKSSEDILREAVIHTYKIREDDRRLRTLPADFEKQRGAYPVRREFPFYKINMVNAPSEVSEILNKLGFSLLNN
jgi:erythronate-4-phosphate dehydrogenase